MAEVVVLPTAGPGTRQQGDALVLRGLGVKDVEHWTVEIVGYHWCGGSATTGVFLPHSVPALTPGPPHGQAHTQASTYLLPGLSPASPVPHHGGVGGQVGLGVVG